MPRLVSRPLWSFKLGNWSFWLITFGITLMGLDLTLAGLQQGYMLMAGAEWLDTLVVDPAVLAGAHGRRHLDGHRHVAAGLQPDAHGAGGAHGAEPLQPRPAAAAARRREDPRRERPWHRYGLRFYALVGGFGCISLAAFVQGVLPMLEPQSRTDTVTKVVRTDLGELKWMEHQASDYTPLELRGRAGLHPRGLLVLPLAVRAAGHRRDAALGADHAGRRIRLRPAAPVLDAPHRAGPVARRPQVQRRLAPGALLGSAHAVARLDHAALRRAVRRARTRPRSSTGADGTRTIEKTAGDREALQLRQHRAASC